jgi:hypothetical protein
MALSGFKASMPLTETVVDARLATMPPAPNHNAGKFTKPPNDSP